MPETLFITGATGFLGRAVMTRFLQRNPDLHVVALVRAADDKRARDRMDEVLKFQLGDAAEQVRDRVTAVVGDITKERLGLSPTDWSDLAHRVDRVIHSAASVRFDLPYDRAKIINVNGSTSVLDLVKDAKMARGRAPRLDYIGTTYVAGDRTDLVLETELNVGQGFRNSYEQTKLESEQHVRDMQGDYPIAIHRPSIIMGHSKTGLTTNFNVIYWPIRIYAKGWWNIFIGNLDAPLDFVPVDWVADAIHHIAHKDEALGNCYQLAAGPDRHISVGQMAELVTSYFDDGPGLDIITPEVFWTELQPKMYETLKGPMRTLVDTGAQYMGYFEQNPVFDVTQAGAILADSDLTLPETEPYFNILMDYCKRSNWGRKVEPKK